MSVLAGPQRTRTHLAVTVMKSNKESSVRHTLTPCEYLTSPLRVRMGAYVQFSDWMDGQLRKLVARWGHLAPPRREDRGCSRP